MDFLGLEADSADIEETSIPIGMDRFWSVSELTSVASQLLEVPGKDKEWDRNSLEGVA